MEGDRSDTGQSRMTLSPEAAMLRIFVLAEKLTHLSTVPMVARVHPTRPRSATTSRENWLTSTLRTRLSTFTACPRYRKLPSTQPKQRRRLSNASQFHWVHSPEAEMPRIFVFAEKLTEALCGRSRMMERWPSVSCAAGPI